LDEKLIVGQHNSCNISFLTPTTKDQTVPENHFLRFSIESPRKILHDFQQESFCMVPVIFHINNVSHSTPLSFYLETLKPHEQKDQVPRGNKKQGHYFWAGTTQHYVPALQPESEIALESFVCFSRPGIYNLNRYKFCLKDNEKNIIKQIYSPFQHMVMVTDKHEMDQLS